MDRGLLIDAIAHLEIAVRQSPSNPRYLAALGEAWLLQGDAEAALAPLERSVSLERHPRVTCLMALALLRLDRPLDAERFAEAALEEAPFFHRAWFVRAQSRISGGRRMAAADDLREARRLEPCQNIYCLRLAALLIDIAWEDASLISREAMLQEALGLLSEDGAKRAAAKVSGRMSEMWTYFQGCLEAEVGAAEKAVSLLLPLRWPHGQECAYRRGLAFAFAGESRRARGAFEIAGADPELQAEAKRRLSALEEGPEVMRSLVPRIPRVDLLETHALGPTEVLGMRGGRLSFFDESAAGPGTVDAETNSEKTPPPFQPHPDTTHKPKA